MTRATTLCAASIDLLFTAVYGSIIFGILTTLHPSLQIAKCIFFYPFNWEILTHVMHSGFAPSSPLDSPLLLCVKAYALARCISLLQLLRNLTLPVCVPFKQTASVSFITRVVETLLFLVLYCAVAENGLQSEYWHLLTHLSIIGSFCDYLSAFSSFMYTVFQECMQRNFVEKMTECIAIGVEKSPALKNCKINSTVYVWAWVSSSCHVFKYFAYSFLLAHSVYNSPMLLHYPIVQLFFRTKIIAFAFAFYGLAHLKDHTYCFHPTLRPFMCPFLLTMHGAALISLYYACTIDDKLKNFSMFYILYLLGGTGVTAGNHRYWAHRSYQASSAFRWMLLFMSSLANQGCIYHWARDHRVHHKYSDTDQDPHNASRGFFYSHCGWLLEKKSHKVKQAGYNVDLSDLAVDPLVNLQRRLDPWWNQFICFVLPGLFTAYDDGNFWRGFLIGGVLRWVFLLHCTWTVNSLAHLYGQRPYNPHIYACESLFTSLLAVGEGWHNWHHLYPFDYAASEGGAFKVWNPTKFLLDTAAKFGMVYNRKRALSLWKAAKSRIQTGQWSNYEKKVALAQNRTKKIPSFSDSLPDCIKLASNIHGMKSLLRDVLFCASVAIIGVVIQVFLVNPIHISHHKCYLTTGVILWLVYSVAQGTLAFGLWVLGYECSMRRFCTNLYVNHIIGASVHTLLLIPYRPKPTDKLYQHKKICLLQAFRADSWALFKLPFLAVWEIQHYLVISMLSLMALAAYNLGLFHVLYWYVGAWVVLNVWIHVYHWLILNESQASVAAIRVAHEQTYESNIYDSPQRPTEQVAETKKNDQHEIEILEYFTPAWLQSVWPVVTKRQGYPWSNFISYFHHHISLSYFIESINAQIPHYHVREAWNIVGQLLDDYDADITDAKLQLLKDFKYQNEIIEESKLHLTENLPSTHPY